jgi:ligand-binding sensor domain-containing protein
LLLIIKSGFTFCQNFETSDGDHKKLIQYNIDNWDIDDGLPTNSLNDIIQTNDGYIWISSYNGLIRYDGINFKVFDKSNTHVFKENGIGLLAVDSKGVLWMTTQNSGLVSFHEGIFKSYGPDVGIEHLVPVILIDSNDRIWSMSIEKGWFVFDGKEFNFLNPGDDIGNQELQAIAEDHSGKIWFGTVESGLFVYNKQTFISFTKENGLISNRIRSIAVDKKGIIWIASDKGLQIFKDNRFETLNVMKDIIINSIISDSNGNLWFATTKGLFFRNDKTGIFENLNTDNGLINNYINNILIDIEDNIWIVYYKAGFSRLNSNKFISYTEQKGLPGTLVNSVCEIESNKFLLAFDDGQICLIENGTIKPYKFIKGLTGERIRHLYKDSKKNLWISTYSGLLKIEPSGNEVWYNTETGFPGKYIRMVFEDSRKNIWVGTRNTGLIKINKDGTYTCYDKSKGLQSSIIMSIDEDRDGNLIIGTSKGGLHLLSSDGKIEHFSVDNGLSGDIVFNTYCDSDNNIWICTNGGLCCYINNRIYKLKQNTFNIYPFDILEDDQEDFWMSTVNGVVKVNRSCLLEQITTKRDSCSFKVYGKFDGIKQPECNATASGLKAENGTLWFPTLDGVTTVDPNNIKYNDHVPPVFIEEIFIDNIPVLNRDTTIYIEPGRKRVTFNFMALSYNEPKKVKFKYKLVGFENEWSDPVSERTVSYTNLSPGSYTFMVIACNNDEVWNDQGAEVKFVVVPHFYQRDIFYFMAILSLIIFAYLIYRLRVKSLTQERKRLENIVKIRTEEVNKKNH